MATLWKVTTPGPGFTVEADSAEAVATWAEQFLPCPPSAHRERRTTEHGLSTVVVARSGRVLTGATIRPTTVRPRGPVNRVAG